ncbi:MAG TPA: D-alanyl-D-alanine carboxypeptidase family protein [Methylophilaceae bacterium]|nr:D-alanyl-D-alanine carboxypeptidase family protein [Methylophilaceae bacterium]HQR60767.1 D-alanyl-D-alanine carboxypeptidase family protein [Methylophilaceae bacterium]
MRLLALLFTLLFSLIASAGDVPPPPTVSGKSYILSDFNSGAVLAEQNSHERISPASLTKLMTAYLSFKAIKQGHLKLDQTVPVSENAWKGRIGCGGAQSSCMFIAPDIPVTVDELLHGMIIQSGNDACVALAEAIAGSEQAFADLMNKEAARLGMKDTQFRNASGLDEDGHYTTAYDLSLLAAALIRDFPDQYDRLYKVKEYTYNNIKQMNRNRLLWIDPAVDGMKTGHTSSAGYCLIASAKHGNMRLISVFAGAPTEKARIIDSQKLLNYGFLFYETRPLYRKGQSISKLRVWKGQEQTLDATVAEDLYVTLPKGNHDKLSAQVTSKQPLIAPVSAGQDVGSLQVALDGKPLLQRKLVAAKEVPIAGIFGRMWDSLKLMFN